MGSSINVNPSQPVMYDGGLLKIGPLKVYRGSRSLFEDVKVVRLTQGRDETKIPNNLRHNPIVFSLLNKKEEIVGYVGTSYGEYIGGNNGYYAVRTLFNPLNGKIIGASFTNHQNNCREQWELLSNEQKFGMVDKYTPLYSVSDNTGTQIGFITSKDLFYGQKK